MTDAARGLAFDLAAGRGGSPPASLSICAPMTMSGSIREILLRGGSSIEIKDAAKREGMKTLIESGVMVSGDLNWACLAHRRGA